jgi:hypothetical protein
LQRCPALICDPTQISGDCSAFPLKQDEEDQRRDHRYGGMKQARHPRYDHKYDSLRGDVVKPVLVPARQFPPAVKK